MDDMSLGLLGDIVFEGLQMHYRLGISNSGEAYLVFESRLGHPGVIKIFIGLDRYEIWRSSRTRFLCCH